MEGLCQGIDEELVTSALRPKRRARVRPTNRIYMAELGDWVTIPTTYAGGAKSISDLALVDRLSEGTIDLTYGRHVVFSPLMQNPRPYKIPETARWISSGAS